MAFFSSSNHIQNFTIAGRGEIFYTFVYKPSVVLGGLVYYNLDRSVRESVVEIWRREMEVFI